MQQYWYWKKFFNKEQITSLVNCCEKNNIGLENPENGAMDTFGNFKKNSTVKVILWSQIKHLLTDLEDAIKYVNYRNFGFNLNSMTNLRHIFYNSYSCKNEGKYDWHEDSQHSTPLIDTKLSLIINISNEEYKGGDFELNFGDPKKITEFSEPGDMILFRSHILHRVLPVLKGERKSLAIFFEGPKFV